MGKTVVVLGGGVGGVVAAHHLRRRLPKSDRVVLIDREPVQHYAPSLLWTLTGTRAVEGLSRKLSRLRRHGIQVELTEVTGIDVDASEVQSPRGVLRYDRLIVALGAQLDPSATPGFDAAAHNFYEPEGATSGRDALQAVDSGRVVVAVAGAPYKCPAAPWEAALLADSVLRQRGVRDRCSVAIYTPEPQPMPVAGPEVGQEVRELLEARDIEVHLGHTLDRVDAAGRHLVFADGTTAGFDVLLGVPVHRPPEAITASPLAGPSGYIPVDPTTLATSREGVYAIGDVTAAPIDGGMMVPKAGVFAHAQAKVVADRVVDELAGRVATATFDGQGACFVEVGGGRAAYAAGDLYAPGGPSFDLHPPARRWHAAKVGLERYWLTRWWW